MIKNAALPFLLLSILGLSGTALGSESTSLPQYPLKEEPSPTMASPPVSSLAMGQFIVKLESTKLEDILEKTKVGEIKKQGDASEYVEWICYTINDTTNPARLWLSSGEIDGGLVDAVVIRSMSTKEGATKACPELPDKFKPVKLDRKIWIQSKESDVRKIFGKPSLNKDGWLYYRYKQTIAHDPRAKNWHADDWTVYGGLSLRIHSGKVIEIWATKQEGGD